MTRTPYVLRQSRFRSLWILTGIFWLLMSFFSLQAQVGINTASPNPNAILELYSSPSYPGGLLLPRVSLNETTDASPLQHHVQGMFVYNLANNADVFPGLYYNDGTKWVHIKGSADVSVGWELLGNASTDPDIHYLGTNDAQPLVVRIYNNNNPNPRAVFTTDGNLQIVKPGGTDNARPPYSWEGTNTSTGIKLIPDASANRLSFVTGQSARLEIEGNQVLGSTRGSQAAPFYSWYHSKGTGFHTNTSHTLFFDLSKTAHFEMNTNRQLLHRAPQTQTADKPSYSWYHYPTTGLFMPLDKTIGFTTGGLERLRIPNANQVRALAAGTESRPFYSWMDEPGTGLHREGTDYLGFSIEALNRFRITKDGQMLQLNGESTEASPTYSWEDAPDTGLYITRTPSTSLSLTTEGEERFEITENQVLATTSGTATEPFYAWNTQEGTGFFKPVINSHHNLGFTIDELERFRMNELGQLLKVDAFQSAQYPALSWDSSPKTGFFLHSASDTTYLSIGTVGVERIRFPDYYQMQGYTGGSEDKPFYSWESHDGTGFQRSGSKSIAFSVAAQRSLRIYDNGKVLVNSTASDISELFLYVVARQDNETAIYALAEHNNGIAIYADGTAGNGLAAYFFGDVTGNFVSSSDRRFKTNIQSLSQTYSVLDKIKQLRPVSYYWKTEQFPVFNNRDRMKTYGFIAQEMETVFPELVSEKSASIAASTSESGISGQYKAVNYVELVPILTAGVQEQQAQLESTDDRLTQLEEKMARLLAQKMRKVAD